MKIQQSSKLLSIPPEIRKSIYGKLETKRHSTTATICEGQLKEEVTICTSFNTCLIRVCKQIHDEYIDETFQDSEVFVVTSGHCEATLSALASQYASLEKNLRQAHRWTVSLSFQVLWSRHDEFQLAYVKFGSRVLSNPMLVANELRTVTLSAIEHIMKITNQLTYWTRDDCRITIDVPIPRVRISQLKHRGISPLAPIVHRLLKLDDTSAFGRHGQVVFRMLPPGPVIIEYRVQGLAESSRVDPLMSNAYQYRDSQTCYSLANAIMESAMAPVFVDALRVSQDGDRNLPLPGLPRFRSFIGMDDAESGTVELSFPHTLQRLEEKN